jgi:hypothetical protein
VICLFSTPPAALISSTASLIASRTVTSLIAIVPESELSRPTLTVGPEVSTTAPPPADGALALSPVLAPQAVSAATENAAAATATARRPRNLNMKPPCPVISGHDSAEIRY